MISAPSIEPTLPAGATFDPVTNGRGHDVFKAVLDRAAKDRDREAVREAAAQLVSSTFIMPILQASHEGHFLEPPFAPSFAEKRFQPLLDQHVADRITSAAGFPLIDVIVDRLMGSVPDTPDPTS